MATLTNILMTEQRDDAPSESSTQVKGDYFFLFESQIENRFAKPRREPRHKQIFRSISRRRILKGVPEWRRTRTYGSNSSPDTTALMSEDEHSLIHSCHAYDQDDEDVELLSTTESEGIDPHMLIWPETMSLVADDEQAEESSPTESTLRSKTDNRKVLVKKWKSRMRKSLRDTLAKAHLSSSKSTEEYAIKVKEEEADDNASKSSNISFLQRAKRSLGVSGRNKDIQRAKALLHEEEIGLYVTNSNDEVETVTRSTYEQLCLPSFPEARDQAPPPATAFPETVSLDNGYAIAHLMHQGKTSLAVNYDSDCPQLELQSDDEYDPEDDISFADPALPELAASGSEETEYNLFNQSSVEEDNGTPCGRYPSLLAPTSTVSEDPSLLGSASALSAAWPLPRCRNQLEAEGIILSESSDDILFVQQSSSTETSRRLGAAPPPASVQKQQEEAQEVNASSSDEEEHRLGISCPAYAAKASLEDAADVWKRIYAPPSEDPPSPTVVQKSNATWGLDASPVSVHSDITESEAAAPAPTHIPIPFYNIRRYTSCGGVAEEDEDHPFDEVDSNACAPRPVRPAVVKRETSFGCGVPELVRSINLSHRDTKEEESLLGQAVISNEAKPVRPRCDCVKCSVTNMYANLLAKK